MGTLEALRQFEFHDQSDVIIKRKESLAIKGRSIQRNQVTEEKAFYQEYLLKGEEINVCSAYENGSFRRWTIHHHIPADLRPKISPSPGFALKYLGDFPAWNWQPYKMSIRELDHGSPMSAMLLGQFMGLVAPPQSRLWVTVASYRLGKT